AADSSLRSSIRCCCGSGERLCVRLRKTSMTFLLREDNCSRKRSGSTKDWESSKRFEKAEINRSDETRVNREESSEEQKKLKLFSSGSRTSSKNYGVENLISDLITAICFWMILSRNPKR